MSLDTDCLQLWGAYGRSPYYSLEIDPSKDQFHLADFFIDFFERRDKALGDPDYPRIEQDTINFDLFELAEAILWRYTSKELASFLKRQVHDDDAQSHMIINRIEIFDKYYDYIFYSKFTNPQTKKETWHLLVPTFYGNDLRLIQDELPKYFFSNTKYPSFAFGFPEVRRDRKHLMISKPIKVGRKVDYFKKLKERFFRQHPPTLMMPLGRELLPELDETQIKRYYEEFKHSPVYRPVSIITSQPGSEFAMMFNNVKN